MLLSGRQRHWRCWQVGFYEQKEVCTTLAFHIFRLLRRLLQHTMSQSFSCMEQSLKALLELEEQWFVTESTFTKAHRNDRCPVSYPCMAHVRLPLYIMNSAAEVVEFRTCDFARDSAIGLCTQAACICVFDVTCIFVATCLMFERVR